MSSFTPTPSMLLHWLDDVVIRFHLGNSLPDCSGGIKLLEPGDSPLSAGFLYLGEADTVAQAITEGRLPAAPVLILSSGTATLPGPENGLPDRPSLIEARLPLLPLYNRVQERLHRFRQWEDRLKEVVYTNAGLQELLQRAAEELNATILLMNVGYKHVASVYSPGVSEPIADELRDNGYLAFDTIQDIYRELPARRETKEDRAEYISRVNNYNIIQLIRYQGDVAARLCVILNGPEPSPYVSELTTILADYVREYMFSHQGAAYGGNSAFGTLAADLIECRLTDPEELEHRLKQINLAVRRYYHVMVIAFEKKPDGAEIPWNYIISRLEYVFPFSNITTYQGEILLIIRKSARGSQLMFQQDKLLDILESYNGFAAVGNTSKFLTSLPPMYRQTKDALRLGRVIDPDKRIFYYEDYSFYEIVEMAAEAARQNLDSQNLVHLCNNEIVSLVTHDKKYGTNLTEVLRTYLRCERNTTEAAKALFIHRNTMLYKIHKIESIINADLDNPVLRERLLFSCWVLDYISRYRNEDLLRMKRLHLKDREHAPTTEP